MPETVLVPVLIVSLLLGKPQMAASPVAEGAAELVSSQQQTLAVDKLDLTSRHQVESINQGFKENILIAVDYFRKDNGHKIVLNPGEVFAFHRNLLPEFNESKVVTQSSGFMARDGYKTVSGLAGNGVCHLASLMNKVATEAGLEVLAPVNHNFARIPGIEDKYGTSIYYLPGGSLSSQKQNLYIKNNKNHPVEFVFEPQDDQILQFSIKKLF